ncbi:MAG TPA: TonB-dependent receptor plug domain-containing protein, partial [Bradyrhizobium sp.]|nr:TonB-dependent receptor plug domain-containing protein [Bradyrhizobium sp.]
MFRFHALGGVSVLALLLAPATIANANHDLPPVTVDAPAPAKRAVRKPAPRPTSSARRSQTAATAPQRQLPVVVANAEGSGPAVPGTPPLKQRYQLPQTSESVTAKDIQEKINVVDTEDAVKYLPSLFVRKRNYGDTQPVLATRTSGLGASARSLVYADDILLSALIANNNSIGAPRWGLVAPEEIQRVDFLYGPFSAAYPGNSAGGVLLITTRMPEKFEITAKQTEALQTFDFYKTKNTYRTDQTSVSVGDKNGNFSYFLSGNFQ